MVTTEDKISLLIDTNELFKLNDQDVCDVLLGDSYKISETYKKMLEIFKNNQYYKFKHIMSGEVKYLNEWMKFYRCNINDSKSITIFLRLAKPMLLKF